MIKVYRHFDQVKRVEKSPKAKQGYALNELMQGIMNWLCHEFSPRSMNCEGAHYGDKMHVSLFTVVRTNYYGKKARDNNKRERLLSFVVLFFTIC